jgi:ferredoxin, 2Fe-2S
MPSVTFIQPDGASETLDIPAGENVMQGACDAGVRGIPGECGGNAMCATCHVFVAQEFYARLPPMDENEDGLLDGTATPREPTSRLSCQMIMTAELDGLVVRIPKRQT